MEVRLEPRWEGRSSSRSPPSPPPLPRSLRPRPLGLLRTSSLVSKLAQAEAESDWHLDLIASQRANRGKSR